MRPQSTFKRIVSLAQHGLNITHVVPKSIPTTISEAMFSRFSEIDRMKEFELKFKTAKETSPIREEACGLFGEPHVGAG
jgi:hypothetical protein